ncbi:MAG: hypothetical protein Q7S74_00770 [Nanoarchaeota archaeon]|nr:hypothetical protein [Nanoarchaeota archaeon]
MREVKYGALFLIASLVFTVFLVSVVSAAGFNSQVDSFLSDAIDTVKPIFQYTLGADGLDSSLFFVKVLLFFVMLAVLYIAVDKVPGISDRPVVTWIITIIVAILGTRFLTTVALVNLVWLPSGVVGIALTTLLPFIIYFFFVESFDSRIIRRVGWIFFVVLFMGLAISRWSDLANGSSFNLGWIYVITAGLSLLSFVFDRTIHAKFLMMAIEQKGAELNALGVSRLQTDIQNWRQVITNPASTPAVVNTAKRQIKDLEKKMRDLLKT